MCYYNGVKIEKTETIKLKNLEKQTAAFDFLNKPVNIGFDYNLYPVIKANASGTNFELVQMEWGFIPFYIKSRQELYSFRNGGTDPITGKFKPPIITLNAIGEELFEKVTYKQSALSRRCLVLSSGFFEWRHVYPMSKKTGKPLKTAVKYPYYIYLPDRPFFFMAGIWTPWTDKTTGEMVESFAIITTHANPLMAQIHNSKKRMPVILNEDLAYEWIFADLNKERITEIATTQYDAQKMDAYPLAKDFLYASDPLKKVEYAELPDLSF